jgi:uncharacterized membrane protein YdjX (TVP38/TMEM64 family)
VDADFVALAREHPLSAAIAFVLLRALAIVIAPIPGVVVDVIGIAIFGWFRAFLFAELGIMLGAYTAYSIGRNFHERAVGRFTALKRVQQWQHSLSEREQFWALVALRLPTNPAFDYISYAAGLTGCRPLLFLASTFVGNVPSVLLFFYVGGQAARLGVQDAVIILVAVCIAGFLLYRIWRRRLTH